MFSVQYWTDRCALGAGGEDRQSRQSRRRQATATVEPSTVTSWSGKDARPFTWRDVQDARVSPCTVRLHSLGLRCANRFLFATVAGWNEYPVKAGGVNRHIA